MKKVLQGARFMLRSRGWGKGFKRLGLILKRFGFTPKRQLRRVQAFCSLLNEYEAGATFFVPAAVWEKYAVGFTALAASRIEWGVHSDIHTDLSRMGAGEQQAHLENARRIFLKAGQTLGGFRAPYLKTNADSYRALTTMGGWTYDSSRSIYWENAADMQPETLEWMARFYQPQFHTQAKALPYPHQGLLQIPVSLPDDDMLVDREEMETAGIAAAWGRMLTACHRLGEVFVLQLHPERIFELQGVMRGLLEQARRLQPAIWVATLGEVAAWEETRPAAGPRWPAPYTAVFCITGDIDALTLVDFCRRLTEW